MMVEKLADNWDAPEAAHWAARKVLRLAGQTDGKWVGNLDSKGAATMVAYSVDMTVAH